MKTRVTKLLALFLMLAMIFTLASCLPEIGGSSSKKDSDEDETKAAQAKTSEIEGIESRLEELEQQYMLSFQRMTQEERHDCVDWLQNDLYVNLAGDISKGYSVEQNANNANILLFTKSADAKAVESAIIDSAAGYDHIQVTRKNCVVIYGDSALVDLILNTKTSSTSPQRPSSSKESTDGYYGEQTTNWLDSFTKPNGSYEYDASYEPGITIKPSYTATDEKGNIIVVRPSSTDENGNPVTPSYSFELVYPSVSGEAIATATPNVPNYSSEYDYVETAVKDPNNGDTAVGNDHWATVDPSAPIEPDANDGYDMWMVKNNWEQLLKNGKLTSVEDYTAEQAPLYRANLIEWGANLTGDLISVHEVAYEPENNASAMIYEFSNAEDADNAREVMIEKLKESDPNFDSIWVPQYGSVVFVGQSDWVYYLVP